MTAGWRGGGGGDRIVGSVTPRRGRGLRAVGIRFTKTGEAEEGEGDGDGDGDETEVVVEEVLEETAREAAKVEVLVGEREFEGVSEVDELGVEGEIA